MRNILCVLILALGIACQPKSKPSTPTDTPATTAQANQDSTVPTYPSITQEMMNMLWDECTNIDYIFYKLPYSISTNNNQESRQLLRHISKDPAPMLPNCPAIATIMYVGQGKQLMQASLHLSESPCSYVVFYENNQPKYGNYLTPEGLGYMRQLFSSVKIQNQ